MIIELVLRDSLPDRRRPYPRPPNRMRSASFRWRRRRSELCCGRRAHENESLASSWPLAASSSARRMLAIRLVFCTLSRRLSPVASRHDAPALDMRQFDGSSPSSGNPDLVRAVQSATFSPHPEMARPKRCELLTPDSKSVSSVLIAGSCWEFTSAQRRNTMHCKWPPRRRSSLQRLSLCPRRSPPLPMLESDQNSASGPRSTPKVTSRRWRSAPPLIALEPRQRRNQCTKGVITK